MSSARPSDWSRRTRYARTCETADDRALPLGRQAEATASFMPRAGAARPARTEAVRVAAADLPAHPPSGRRDGAAGRGLASSQRPLRRDRAGAARGAARAGARAGCAGAVSGPGPGRRQSILPGSSAARPSAPGASRIVAQYVAVTHGVGPLYDELHALYARSLAPGPCTGRSRRSRRCCAPAGYRVSCS